MDSCLSRYPLRYNGDSFCSPRQAASFVKSAKDNKLSAGNLQSLALCNRPSDRQINVVKCDSVARFVAGLWLRPQSWDA